MFHKNLEYSIMVWNILSNFHQHPRETAERVPLGQLSRESSLGSTQQREFFQELIRIMN
jgi:hypothetical protein